MPRIIISASAALLTLVSTVLSNPSAAKVSTLTGDDFLRYCVSNERSGRQQDEAERDYIINCWGYFAGSMDTIIMLSDSVVCPPSGTSPADVILVTYNWLAKNPSKKSDYLAAAMFAAMSEKWPCKS